MKTHELNYLSKLLFALAVFAGTVQAKELHEQITCHATGVTLLNNEGKQRENAEFFFRVTIYGTPEAPRIFTSLNSGKDQLQYTATTDDPYFDKANTAMYFGPMVDEFIMFYESKDNGEHFLLVDKNKASVSCKPVKPYVPLT
ncbi:MAG: hypothetical protein K0R94_1564 [Burkholderiales bacterium]|nr:hypothetical protein [Burkholderiales bacterium]